MKTKDNVATTEDGKLKQEFVGWYLDEKMKNHGLPYGMDYYNLLSKMIDKAEKAWIKHQNTKK
jgi:hypothetical protein